MSTPSASWLRPLLIVAAAALTTGCGASTPGAGGVPDAPDAPDTSSGSGSSAKSGGPKAPDFTLPSLDGDSISLSDYEGEKVVIVDFWATTCDPCLAEMPELIELYEKKKDQGFEILAVATDGSETQAAVSATVAKFKMPFPILLDPETEVMDLYNPKGILPFTVIVDRNGGMVFTRASFQAGDTKAMESLTAEVDAALAKK